MRCVLGATLCLLGCHVWLVGLLPQVMIVGLVRCVVLFPTTLPAGFVSDGVSVCRKVLLCCVVLGRTCVLDRTTSLIWWTNGRVLCGVWWGLVVG